MSIATLRDEIIKQVHMDLVGGQVAEYQAKSKACYARQDISGGYWNREKANLLSIVGYDRVLVGSRATLSSVPPPGEIWVRPAESGRYSKSRITRKGRPLTISEMEVLIRERRVENEYRRSAEGDTEAGAV